MGEGAIDIVERSECATSRRARGVQGPARILDRMESTLADRRADEVRAAVVAATWDELVEHGYEAVAVEQVARRAGLPESTVRDRWGDADALVDVLLDEFAQHDLVLLNTGSFETDLRALSAGIAALYDDPHRRAVISELVHAAGRTPRAAETLRRFWTHRIASAAEPVRRAIADGEVPAATDPLEVIRALGAPFYYRMFITLEPLDDALAERAAAAAIAAARAGVFATSSS
jgi:AcrR family transcriptional regulator